jgi:hypothetical protein
MVLFLSVGYILSMGLWAKPLIRNETLSLKRRRKTSGAAGADFGQSSI